MKYNRLLIIVFAILFAQLSHAGFKLSKQRFVCEYGDYSTFKLSARVWDVSEASDGVTDDVIWSSSNEDVVEVDATGTVTVHSSGTATITATFIPNSHLTDQCFVNVLPIDGHAESLLREDLVWVGGGYRIQIDGDTIVDGVSYKKVYRLLDNGAYDPNLVHRSIFASPYTPAACLRQASNGRIYRLCDYDRLSTDWDSFNWVSFNVEYSAVVNSTETHYEVVMYDFGQPDVYEYSVRCRQEKPLTLKALNDAFIPIATIRAMTTMPLKNLG